MGFILLAIIIALLIVVFRKNYSLKKPDTAIDTLRNLFAKGDITIEEFENRKSVLINK